MNVADRVSKIENLQTAEKSRGWLEIWRNSDQKNRSDVSWLMKIFRTNEQRNKRTICTKKIRKFFEVFRKLFDCFVISKIFPEIGRAETIHLVRKSSNFEPSSRFFGRLKIWTSGRTSSDVEIEDVIFSNMPLIHLLLYGLTLYRRPSLGQGGCGRGLSLFIQRNLNRAINQRVRKPTLISAAETAVSAAETVVSAAETLVYRPVDL